MGMRFCGWFRWPIGRAWYSMEFVALDGMKGRVTEVMHEVTLYVFTYHACLLYVFARMVKTEKHYFRK